MPQRSGPAAGAAKISYQGEPGANSHLAAREAYSDLEAVAYPTFEDAIAAVTNGEVHYAMIPIENSVAGRVADIHHLLPDADLYIVGEHFLRVRHQLMAKPGASLAAIKRVMSHTQALGQCRMTLSKLGITPVPEADTAGSARLVAESDDLTTAAIASRLAAEIYGLKILKSDMEDEAHNTTRFVTSVWVAMARPGPSASAQARAASPLMSATTTFPPSAANNSAIPRPKPDAAPVTMAILSLRRIPVSPFSQPGRFSGTCPLAASSAASLRNGLAG
jgi:prephenate dehydratase